MGRKIKLSSKSLFILLISIVLVFGAIFFAMRGEKRKASDTTTGAKSAAIHLYHDEFVNTNYLYGLGGPAGQASTSFSIPKEVINNDFTIRVSLKGGEYDMMNASILRIVGNGNDCGAGGGTRFSWTHDSSPISHVQMYNRTGVCNGTTPEFVRIGGSQFDGGTRTTDVYEDYFFIYKKPILGISDGYFRVYRALKEGQSIIPLSLNTSYPRLDYPISKDINMEWGGNDTAFKLIVGDNTNKLYNYGNGHVYAGQDIKISELTMWKRVLDSDMALFSNDPTYYAHYYGHYGNFDKYQSPTINSITHKSLIKLSSTYLDQLFLYYGTSDEGLSSNLWKNTASSEMGLDLVLSGAASLSSDVPDWPNSEYDPPSREVPIVDTAGLSATISSNQVSITGIDTGASSGNSIGLGIRRVLFISSSKDYRYTSIKKQLIPDGATDVAIDGIDFSKSQYFVTVEWIDKLENKTIITKPINNFQKIDYGNTESLHLTHNLNNRIAKTEIPHKFPANQPSTFRLNFKLNQAPATGKSTDLFGIYDRERTFGGYQYLTIKAIESGGKTKIGFQVADGDKYLHFNSSASLLFTGDSEIRIGQWEEFWFSFVQPTSITEGGLYVYRYKRDTSSFEVVYNNTNALPFAWSWFSDWSFKKWETSVFYGGKNNTETTSFYINEASWWSKRLSEQEIANIASKSINKLPKEISQDDYLFWHSEPKVAGGIITPTLGGFAGAYSETAKCYNMVPDSYTYTIEVGNCVVVADVPTFLNTSPNEIVINLQGSASIYNDPNTHFFLEPGVSNASSYLWSKLNQSDDINIFTPNDLKTEISSATPTGASSKYILNFKASNNIPSSREQTIDIHVHKLADINGDNSINFADFSFLLSSWGTPSNPMANIVRTGTSATNVDFQDFSVLLSKWGG